MIDLFVEFVRGDSLVAALLLTAFSVVVLALGRFAWRRWRAHEEQKADHRFQRIAQPNSESRDRIGGIVNYPPRPSGQHSTPWRDHRKDIA